MRLFISAGEPSGDIHLANLTAELRRRQPALEFTGFGGGRLREQGIDLLFPLADHPIMGFIRAAKSIPFFQQRLAEAQASFDRARPDAVIVVDYPGFHWHLAKAAKSRGIPVFYYVPPQLWGWAPWRVRKVRRWFDHLLCSLPFEPAWYRQRGVDFAHYVGHPFFDEIAQKPIDADFVADHRRAHPGPHVLLLSGSRGSELTNNLTTILQSARRIHDRCADARFLLAAFSDQHAERIRSTGLLDDLPLDMHVGRNYELMSLARAAIAVSGSVSLELLHHAVPTAIVYRTPWFGYHVARPLLMRCEYITLVNLMAGAELFPEFFRPTDQSPAIAATVCDWLEQEDRRQHVVAQLQALRQSFGQTGAAANSAAFILDRLAATSGHNQAA